MWKAIPVVAKNDIIVNDGYPYLIWEILKRFSHKFSGAILGRFITSNNIL
jgi:hypothetical protein